MGQALGCILAAAGHDTGLILRERYADVIKSQGLSVSGIFGKFHVPPEGLKVYTELAESTAIKWDYIVITTKTYDTDNAVADLKKTEDTSFIPVSMQNGCGNLEKLVEAFGHRSLAARVITGFEIDTPGHVAITVTADDIHIGSSEAGKTPGSAIKLAEAINRAGLPCSVTPYLQRDLLAKLLYNSALNPLGAILGTPYGILADNHHTRTVMNRVIGEAFAVIEAMGETTHWDTAEEYQDFFYGKQIPATYAHRPSMLQDIENGKPTEIEALTGFISIQGKKNEIPTPICDTLSSLVRFKEKSHI